MYKELLKLNNKKTNNPIEKSTRELDRRLIMEDLQTANEPWKDALHHLLSKKYNFNSSEMPLPTYRNGQSLDHGRHRLPTGCEGRGTLIPCWWECTTVKPPCMTFWQFLTKLNLLLPCGPAIGLLRVCPQGTENLCSHKNLPTDIDGFIHNCPIWGAAKMSFSR